MKAIGGIVTNKESIPDNLRQLDTFTTEVLKQLWKVYSINRDVVDNGRRLENLFWRIWGSERTGRPFSGEVVSAIFMRMHSNDDPLLPRRRSQPRIPGLDIKIISERGQPAPPEPSPSPAVSTPPTSEGIAIATPTRTECPPTPPPSPVPNSMHSGFATHSFLSKQPELSEITISLQKTLQDPLPSPPGPGVYPPSPVVVFAAPLALPTPSPKKVRSPPSPNPATTLDTVTENKASEWISTSFQSTDSWDSRSSTTSKGVGGARAGPLRSKGRRGGKRVTAKMNKPKGIPPPVRRSNTVTSSPTTEVEVVETPSFLPGNTPEKGKEVEKEKGKGKGKEREKEKERQKDSGGWIVDPDFRTKYIDQKQKQKEAARASPTTALSHDTVSVRRVTKGKRKDVLVVDGTVPLKEGDTKVVREDKRRPALPRQKSELTMLIENARKDGESNKATEDKGKGKGKVESVGRGKGKGRGR
ncbi:hypothetical protein BDD12DRAFT_880922 [Trichophaea hybrida]|nr:hypothetical protein BDD12DRAFT_880922 [Trichophaea hybrida]